VTEVGGWLSHAAIQAREYGLTAIVGAEGATAFLELIESGRVGELRCPKDRHGGYAGTLIPAVDYLQAMRLRGPMKRAIR